MCRNLIDIRESTSTGVYSISSDAPSAMPETISMTPTCQSGETGKMTIDPPGSTTHEEDRPKYRIDPKDLMAAAALADKRICFLPSLFIITLIGTIPVVGMILFRDSSGKIEATLFDRSGSRVTESQWETFEKGRRLRIW